MTSLTDFVGRFLGVSGVGNTPENRGQCVGLVALWLDSLALAHVWGNAVDLLHNALPSAYTVELNSPDNYPEPGDVIVWGTSWGGGFGHCGVVLAANVQFVVTFEQNDPAGYAPTVMTHNYAGVVGWLRPKLQQVA